MANRDLMLGQNQSLVLGHSHTLDLGQNHDMDLTQAHHDHEIDLTHQHDDHELGLGNIQNQDEEEDHHHHHHDYMNENDQKPGHHHHHDDDVEFSLSDNNQLVVVGGGDNENLELAIDSTHELEIDHNGEMVMVTTPVQARALSAELTYQLTVGQEFPDVKACRRALRDMAIALHFEIQTIKSDKTRFTAKCSSEGCPWRVHAAKLPGVPTFTIRTIHESHTCGGINHLGHQQASVQWVASSVEQRLRENPNCKPKEILEEIHRVHGITLSYKQAWRGKERIMATMRGSFEQGYRLLPQYCEQVKRTNPGSIASVYGSPADNCFQRLFLSFHASIFGFLNACRPLIGLDRTYLKNKYLGTLLLATGFDGDGALFPLAFGVVDEESDENWMWFLCELHNLLETNTENMPRLTDVSSFNPII